jgi:hypothetical protein
MGNARRLPRLRRPLVAGDGRRGFGGGGQRGPVAVLLVVVLACAALGVVGLGVEHRLQPTSLIVGGTDSARGQALAEAHFGDSSNFAVLLRGPAAAIERQGPGRRLALGPRSGRLPAPGAAAGDHPARLPPAAGRGDARHRAGPRKDAGSAGAPAAGSRPIRVRERIASAAERIACGDRAGRADRRAAAADRPPARLPLGPRRGDPAGARRPHRPCRPRRARPARLGDDDRSALARRLHDDGPGARPPPEGSALPSTAPFTTSSPRPAPSPSWAFGSPVCR